jgi:hypothetical protein
MTRMLIVLCTLQTMIGLSSAQADGYHTVLRRDDESGKRTRELVSERLRELVCEWLRSARTARAQHGGDRHCFQGGHIVLHKLLTPTHPKRSMKTDYKIWRFDSDQSAGGLPRRRDRDR